MTTKPKDTNKWEALIRDYASRGEAEKIIWLFRQTQQDTLEMVINEAKKMEIGEFEGWELATKFNCCPGDDMADAYNQALKDLGQTIKKKMGGK